MALWVAVGVSLGEVTGEFVGLAVGVGVELEGLNFRAPEKISMLGIRIIAISMTARIVKSFFRDFRDVKGGGVGGGGKSMLSLIFPKLIFNIHYILFGSNR
jgi:hypothetical protein